jgi:hypothetical protein
MDSAESSRSNEPARDPETLSNTLKDSPKIQAPKEPRKAELAVDQSERVEAARRTSRTSRRISAGIGRSLIMASIGV